MLILTLMSLSILSWLSYLWSFSAFLGDSTSTCWMLSSRSKLPLPLFYWVWASPPKRFLPWYLLLWLERIIKLVRTAGIVAGNFWADSPFSLSRDCRLLVPSCYLYLICPFGVESLFVRESCCTKHSLITRFALGDNQFFVAWYIEPGLDESTVWDMLPERKLL